MTPEPKLLSPRSAFFFSLALIAGSSAAYWAGASSEDFSPLLAGLSAGFFAFLWGALVFHRMGKSYIKDTLWILLGFVFIGSWTGTVMSYGLVPLGVPMGIYVAIVLPLEYPLVIGPVYIVGIFLAYCLPRIGRSPVDENDIGSLIP